jgi:hypothetical protein
MTLCVEEQCESEVTGMCEIANRIKRSDDVQNFVHIIYDTVTNSSSKIVVVSANPCLDFGEGFFDRVEIGGVWWKVLETDTSSVSELC